LVNPLRKDYSTNSVVEEYLDLEFSSQGAEEIMVESIPHLFELRDYLEKEMNALGLSPLFVETEMPLIRVLAAMECKGVKIDRGRLNGLSREFDQRLNGIIKRIYELAGEPFNINSPQQLSRILFETLGL